MVIKLIAVFAVCYIVAAGMGLISKARGAEMETMISIGYGS